VLESIDLLVSQAEGFRNIRSLGVGSARSDLDQARIDVLVADVILAGSTNGIELCERMIKRHPTIAIVVISADNEVQRSDIPRRGVVLRKLFGKKRATRSDRCRTETSPRRLALTGSSRVLKIRSRLPCRPGTPVQARTVHRPSTTDAGCRQPRLT
jgi:CheY-like chemotaxis protein